MNTIPLRTFLGLTFFYAVSVGLVLNAVAEEAQIPDLFTEHCAQCHGNRGQGGSAPPLVGAPLRQTTDQGSIVQLIANGSGGTGMPGFRETLTGADMFSLAMFIAEQQGLPTSLPSAPPAIPDGVVKSEVEFFRVETVAEVKDPYGIALLPDGRILVTEAKIGALRIIESDKLLPDPVASTPMGAPPKDFFKRRLMDVAVHPRNGWIYLTSTEGTDSDNLVDRGRLILSRGHIRDGQWVDSQTLLTVPNQEGSGGRIAFDSAGRVYIGTVHAPTDDDPVPSQDIAMPHGKILRLNPDGTVPSDNPYVEREDAFPYVWAYGLRSPLGLAMDDQDRLWESENGPRGGDELNLIKPGHNYGWPVITWGHPYDETPTVSRVAQEGMEQPVVSWIPSPAVSGAVFYNADAFPAWKGSLFVCSLKGRTLFRIKVKDERTALIESLLADSDRLRDIAVGPDGYLYLITDSGLVLRLVPA